MAAESWREQAEQNADWQATCAIYGDITTIGPLTSDAVGKEQGFYGCVEITMSTGSTAFFRSIDDSSGLFRFFSFAKQPQIQLQLKYIFPQENELDDEDNDDFAMIPPTSLTVKWNYFPEELPDEVKKPFLTSIWEEASRILNEEQLSYGVCEFCEHQALTHHVSIMANSSSKISTEALKWRVFHENGPYRLIRIPQKCDSMYQTNYGEKIHPYEEARRLPPRAMPNQSCKKAKKKVPPRPLPVTVLEYARQTLIDEWKQLYTTECPICFDTLPYSEGITLPCHHFVCEICFDSLLHFKVKELGMYRTYPFCCPVDECRHALPIIGFVKHHLPATEMDKVRKWIKDMKHPPCFSIDRCLSKACGGIETVRRQKAGSTVVFCDQCNKQWCELCLKRLGTGGKEPVEHPGECDDHVAWKFCNRYLAASDVQKQACEARYPWIVSYAHSRQHDGDAVTWILQNGQVCPKCATGVERIAGCFHMQCPQCATHFCYECGDELFPPYYGTHHCWERTQLGL